MPDLDNDAAAAPLTLISRSWTSDGVEIRSYVSAHGRATAAATTERVRLGRRLGAMCPGVPLTWDEFGAVVALLPAWHERRPGWAAFFFTTAGYPAGFGGRDLYEPAGGAPVEVGSRSIGRRTGRVLTGSDELVPLPAERPATGGFVETHRIVRVGECVGRDREPVGALFRRGELAVEARRRDLTLRKGSCWSVIERDEGAFLEALLRVERLVS